MNSPKNQFTNIDEYISLFPTDVQTKLNELRKVIKETIPEVSEIISYKMPTFVFHGKHLVYFGAYKTHIGFYPFPSGIEAFKEEVKDYETSTGTIKFPLDKVLPLELVKRIVEYRKREILENLKKKA